MPKKRNMPKGFQVKMGGTIGERGFTPSSPAWTYEQALDFINKHPDFKGAEIIPIEARFVGCDEVGCPIYANNGQRGEGFPCILNYRENSDNCSFAKGKERA